MSNKKTTSEETIDTPAVEPETSEAMSFKDWISIRPRIIKKREKTDDEKKSRTWIKPALVGTALGAAGTILVAALSADDDEETEEVQFAIDAAEELKARRKEEKASKKSSTSEDSSDE